jgi:hypothetical protein
LKLSRGDNQEAAEEGGGRAGGPGVQPVGVRAQAFPDNAALQDREPNPSLGDPHAAQEPLQMMISFNLG